MAMRKNPGSQLPAHDPGYGALVSGIADLLEQARRSAARAVNGILTATYWELGRRVVAHEQGGQARAGYGEELLQRLAADLAGRFGRGFSRQNLQRMPAFFPGWQVLEAAPGRFEARAIRSTLSSKSAAGGAPPGHSLDLPPRVIPELFPLPWSHYVRLLSVEDPEARAFYEAEAIRGGWSVRQLDRQVGTQFYERVRHSRRSGALLAKGQAPGPEDAVTAGEEVRDPYLVEFLGLKDEYSEGELEEALLRHLE
jgi:hypothetical protein